MKQPRNETEIHFMLKEIAKYVLWGWGYTMIGTEVSSMYSIEGVGRNPKKGRKITIDVVGVKKIGKFIPHKGTEYYYDVKGIEAKASLADFKNGFCSAPAYTYIIAPKGVIPKELIPDKIGFIEVDFDQFSIEKGVNKIEKISGVNITNKAKKRIDRRFNSESSYREWCSEVLGKVAYRCSHELLFWRNIIEIKKAQ